MSTELVKNFIKKYPELFDKDFEINCGDGWNQHIDLFCKYLSEYIKGNSKFKKIVKHKVKILYIKEKFGKIRIYLNYMDDFIFGLIDHVEKLSSVTCEVCGKIGNIFCVEGWLVCRCAVCLKKK